MSKFGKVLGPVVALLAVAVATLAVLIAMRAKQARYRAQILARNLSETAERLDSGSGIAAQANYKPAGEDNKEGGSLGWTAARDAKDLSLKSNTYDDAAHQVVTLAERVVEQRDAIISTVVKLSGTLECPANSRPDEESLKGLTSYEGGTTAFETFVNNRVSRDRNLKSGLNAFLRGLGVSRTYNGDITPNGVLSAGDQAALADATARFKALKDNYSTQLAFLREFSNELRRAKVNGITWTSSTSSSDYSLSGVNPGDAANISRILNGFRTDMRTVSAQLNLIDNLKSEIAGLKGQLAAKDQEVAGMKQRILEVTKLVETIYDGGGMEYDRKASAPAKQGYNEVAKDLTGHVVKLDEQFGYAVIDLNRSMVVNGLKLGVYRNGIFLGLVKVIEAGEFNSLAVVVGGKAEDMNVGDTLVVAGAAIQDPSLTGK